MKCPYCRNDKTYVLKCGNGETGYDRQRKCPRCKKVFGTVETYTGINSHEYKMRKLKRRKPWVTANA